MAKRVLVLNGHPVAGGFVDSLCDAYGAGVQRAGHELRVMNIEQMKFEVDLVYGHNKETPLEASLAEFQENLKWCDHFVLGYPLWWGSVPAKVKGLIDRTFLPGFAFSFDNGATSHDGLMAGKSVLLMVTSNASNWHLKWFHWSVGFRMMKSQVFEYCGFGPVALNHYAPAQTANESQKKQWLAQAMREGARLK